MERSGTFITNMAVFRWEVTPVDNKTRQAIGYCRLSDRAATGTEISLERQENEIRRWCVANGLELVAVHSDVGKSGRKLNRAGLDAAISDCSLRGAILVSYSLDRIARNPKVLERLKTERVAFRALDVPQVSEMMIDLMMVFAKMYSDQIAKKMVDYHAARKEKAAKGLCEPHPVPKPCPNPAVSRNTMAAARAVRDQQATRRNSYVWTKIEPMVAAGKSFRQIANELNQAGFVASRGGKWNHVAVARIAAKFSPTPAV